MFGKSKDGPVGHDQTAAPSSSGKVAPPQQAEATAELDEVISCISSGMTLVGKLVGDGVLKIFGSVEGELRGSSVTVYEGAQVVGDLTAQEVTIAGHVKGTIRGIRVTLQGTAVVDGEISHRSLMIDESAQFEGTSRRSENLADKSPSAAQPVPQPQGGLAQGNGHVRAEHDDKTIQAAE